MDHAAHSEHVHHHAMNIECDGSMSGDRKGSWKGHVLPGSIFIIWGSWWAYAVCWRLLWARSTNRRRFQSQSFYAVPLRFLSLLEPTLKVILPPIAVSIELYFDHDAFRSLKCPPDTLYAGRFAISHLNNWQHSASYPAFVLSGLVEIISTKILLPQGTTHAMLGLAFTVMAFLMGTHEKAPGSQDAMVHWLLFVSMVLCAMFVFLEVYAPHNPLPALGRAAATIFQGAWLCQIAAIEFEDRIEWSEKIEGYHGGAMVAPVYFCMIGVLVVSAVLALVLVMGVSRQWNLVPRKLYYNDTMDAQILHNQAFSLLSNYQAVSQHTPFAGDGGKRYASLPSPDEIALLPTEKGGACRNDSAEEDEVGGGAGGGKRRAEVQLHSFV